MLVQNLETLSSPGIRYLGLYPAPQLGELQVEEDEEGAHDATQYT